MDDEHASHRNSDPHATALESLYAAFLTDPASVSPAWAACFRQLGPGAPDLPGARPDAEALRDKQVLVLRLINAFRFLGLRGADVDPLKRGTAPVKELDPHTYGLDEGDLDTVFHTGSLFGPARASLREILSMLRQTYCGTIGCEYMHLSDTEQKRWIQARIEGSRSTPAFAPEERRQIFERLTAAECLERYLHARYAGQKRFSLEGGETLIPLLDHLIEACGRQQVAEIVIGMAHRGRLNVLVNILRKSPQHLFQEFEGKYEDLRAAGDLKYHQGFSSDLATAGCLVHVVLAFNPSHLEVVDPVVEGSVRARQHRHGDLEGERVVPFLIHGDAAFSAQGVVMETLNMSQTRGFRTGGTVHLVINNQIGFTTSDPRDTRSSLYCTDVMKMVEAPVFHVNGDDPEAALLVAQIALDYRMTFKRDVVIDLVCFRRLGHDEQDEPAATQPLMYKRIGQHPGPRARYLERLTSAGVLAATEATRMESDYRAWLEAGDAPARPRRASATDWSPYRGSDWRAPALTRLPRSRIARLGTAACAVPVQFKLHPKVEEILASRRLMARGKALIDWGMAETLAYASLLEEGYGVRISGQDSGRGTFFHRHAVLHDQNRERWDAGDYVPLQHVSQRQAPFVVIDSLLSEEAVLGFEYGYSTAEPNELVLWEAQFGDFANGAQVVIDQFISSGEAKWGRLCGLVLMLPHGQEGQGPEHSSARLERFLQLCAEENMQVCQPASASQMFHLLRRQMLRPYRKPLIIMSPKGLLRNPASFSPIEALTEGSFAPVIGESQALDQAAVRRVIVCSGKVYYDLRRARDERSRRDVALIQLPQLYPFPDRELQGMLSAYPAASELVWAQEEPENQGAWTWIREPLARLAAPGQALRVVARPASPSPAAGDMSRHLEQARALLEEAMASA